MSEHTVTINGTVYDAHTGMPLRKASEDLQHPQKTHSAIHSQAMHQTIQKSQTLNRESVKKANLSRGQAETTIQKSPQITKFAPHPNGIHAQSKRFSDIGPVSHPIVAHANAQIRAKHTAQTEPKPSHIIKEEAIQKALEKAPLKTEVKSQQKLKKYPRMLSIASAGVALLLLGGYFTYLNMPSLSVRVAAAQAGINASYPEYRPDGYSLHGPVAYDQNEVMMKFAANAGPQNFTITQAKSSWDSSAVLDNYVKQKAGENYITYNERGLTIYTFDGNAAWVNGGILYTISGDAPLSTDQIRRIATSM